MPAPRLATTHVLLSPLVAYVSGYKHLPSRPQIGTDLPVPGQCRKRDIDHTQIVSGLFRSIFGSFSDIPHHSKLDTDKIWPTLT